MRTPKNCSEIVCSEAIFFQVAKIHLSVIFCVAHTVDGVWSRLSSALAVHWRCNMEWWPGEDLRGVRRAEIARHALARRRGVRQLPHPRPLCHCYICGSTFFLCFLDLPHGFLTLICSLLAFL